MHYLITGGAGFIGSHLAEHLLAGGHRLTIIDDLSTGKREQVSTQAKFIEADITTPQILGALLRGIDGVFHLAAIASVERSKSDWLRTHQVNLGATVALFDAIARSGNKIPVVFASSAAVYGNATHMPITEGTQCQPLSAYGADKYGCELNAAIATTQHTIPTIGLRFFNVYGPRQDPHSPYSGVISIFAGRMKAGQNLTIYGDGEQSRDFIYVDDVTQCLMRAMQALESGAVKHGVFNVATGKAISINMLVKTLTELTGANPAITHGPAREGDIRHSLGDASLTQKTLQFNATTDLKTGLAKTLESL